MRANQGRNLVYPEIGTRSHKGSGDKRVCGDQSSNERLGSQIGFPSSAWAAHQEPRKRRKKRVIASALQLQASHSLHPQCSQVLLLAFYVPRLFHAKSTTVSGGKGGPPVRPHAPSRRRPLYVCRHVRRPGVRYCLEPDLRMVCSKTRLPKATKKKRKTWGRVWGARRHNGISQQ